MAQLPPIKRLSKEDFKEQGSWIGALLGPLNDFMGAVFRALNNGLTFSENLAAQVKDLTVDVQTTGTYPIRFQWERSGRPVALWVGWAQEIAPKPPTLTTAVWADWTFNNGSIEINSLSGLSTGKKYRIRVIIIAG